MQSDEPTSFPPLTPQMVANWAELPLRKVFKVQLACAGAVAAVVMFVLFQLGRPAIWQAIEHLPARAAIEDGSLRWPDVESRTLGSSSMLSIVVAPIADAPTDRLSDWQVVLRPREMQVRSLLGYTAIPYLRGWRVELSRTIVEPLYGAWEAPAFVFAGLITALLLMASWQFLGLLYGFLVVGLASLWARPTSLSKAWKVGMGALIPGSLLMFVGLLGYGFSAVALPRLALLWLLHLALGWIYLLLAPGRLPDGVVRNPFKPKSFASPEAKPEIALNPFTAGDK